MGKKNKNQAKEAGETSEKKDDAPPTPEESETQPEKKSKKKATKKPDDDSKSQAADEPTKSEKPKQDSKKKSKQKEEKKEEEKAPDVATEPTPNDQPVTDTEKPKKNKKKKEKKPKENDEVSKEEQKTDPTVDEKPKDSAVETEDKEETKKKKKKKKKDKSENNKEVKPEETKTTEIPQTQIPEEKPANKPKKDVKNNKEPENKPLNRAAKDKQNKTVDEDKKAVVPIMAEQPAKKDVKTRAKNNKVKAEATEPMIVSAVSVDSETSVPVLNEAQYLKMLEMAAMFSRIKKTTKAHNNMISDNNNTISGVEDSLANLETINSPTQLVWRIPDFKRRFVDARKGISKVLYSPEIDTHRYGYKLGLSLCPNGDGKGAGTHMSLFFSILRGEYDELLPWPFASSLRFTLMDQSQDKKSAKKNIVGTFVPNPTGQNMPFLNQPTTFRNPSLGLPRFAAMIDVWAEEDRYVLDDIVFIKVEVDLNGLETRLDY